MIEEIYVNTGDSFLMVARVSTAQQLADLINSLPENIRPHLYMLWEGVKVCQFIKIVDKGKG